MGREEAAVADRLGVLSDSEMIQMTGNSAYTRTAITARPQSDLRPGVFSLSTSSYLR